ncbi:hybrid sensor histidine kinase/response regulator [Bdellovibrio sp. ArHS]|uniref:ATP-binding response regulator n=1 Tax=Bdellovibrio sp. ArHS TaxID=1569284 RepID=UPI0025C37FC3|nr:hybrid sensor histidine kinase/response regulator [Bdellovibrio sp. ArHS]
MRNLNLLLIEDNEAHAHIIQRYLKRVSDYSVRIDHVDLWKLGAEKLKAGKFDAVLLDLRLPDSDLDQTLSRALQGAQNVPIIVLSSLEDRAIAVKSVQEGAQDYLCKGDLSAELLLRTILNSIERKENERQLRLESKKNEYLLELGRLVLNEDDIPKARERGRHVLASYLHSDYVDILIQHFNFKASSESVLTDFSDPDIQSLLGTLQKQGLKYGILVPLADRKGADALGLIVAYNRDEGFYSRDQIHFVFTVANMLSYLIVRKRLENQLQQKIMDLQDAHQKKDDFIATLSHELRTPLNILAGHLEVLKTSQPLGEEALESIKGIEKNLDLETRLIQETLDLSYIVTGKMQLNLSVFNLRKSIRTVLESFRTAIHAKNLHLLTEVYEELQDFYGDPHRLQQMLWNLLSNAVKFTPRDGMIEFHARKINSTLEFKICDSGKGIARENLRYVFSKFWQEDSSISRHYMGLGLGLGLVKQIAELHGGYAEVESAGPNQGACFTIKLPYMLARQVAAAKTGEAKIDVHTVATSPQPRSSVLSNRKVLIVDDSEDTVALMLKLLRKTGAIVTGYISPEEALEAAKSQGYDLIISDIGMPGLNGYELLTLYRAWEKKRGRKKTPAIALTAYASDDDVKQAQTAGFQLHMTKPMNLKLLEENIRSLLAD